MMNNNINVTEDFSRVDAKVSFKERFSCFFRSLLDKFSKSLYEKNYCYLSFAIPVVIIYFTFACLGMFPFGERSILTLDMDGQYVYFFEQLRDIYTGDASLFYTFERCLGGEFLGYFTYYLSSPLSIIVALFPKKMITEAIMTMMILKSGLSGLSFSVYLGRTRQKNTIGFVMFSTMYALCSYGTMYQFNTMWIDALIFLPLIALGVESLVKAGKFKLFTVSLALAICSNYYIGYMLCIFVAIYFFFCIASIPENEIYHSDRDFCRLKSFLRIAVASVIALMMAAAIIFSAYYSLQFGKSSYQDSSFDAELRFDALNLVAKLFLGSFDTVRFAGTPNIYSGLFTLIMLPAFYISKRVKPREKIFYTVLVLVLVLSFSINSIDLVWHGFQPPIWFNYRYSFLFSFIIVAMAYRGYEEYDSLDTGFIGKIALALIGLLLVIQKTVTLARYEWVDNSWQEIDVKPGYGMLWLSILFILVYLLIFFAKKHTSSPRVATVALAVVVFIEAFSNSLINWTGELKDGGCATRENYRSYVDKIEDATAEIALKDPTFYRMERTLARKSNDGLVANINGLSEFTSTFNASTVSFINRLGFYTSEPTVNYISSNPVSDALLGVKYIIGSGEEDTNGELPGLNSVCGLYKSFTTKNGLVVYENPYALPIAYRVNGDIERSFKKLEFFEGGQSPFKTMNNLFSGMMGEDTSLFKTCDYKLNKGSLSSVDYDDNGGISYRKSSSSSNAYFYFTVKAHEDGNIYMYLPSPYTTAAKLEVDGKTISSSFFQGETQRIMDLGYYEAGDILRVELEFSHYRLYLWDTQDYFVQVDMEKLTQVTNQLKAEGLVIDEFSDTKFVGSLKSAEDGTVFTTIPYDSNWQVYVDGEQVPTYELVDSLLGFDIPSGEHSVEIRYVHKPFIIGAVISVIGIGLFVLLSILDKKRREKSTLNNVTVQCRNTSCTESGSIEGDDKSLQDDNSEKTNENLSEENNDIPS
ncbi:MAG: hypothetical protein E7596_08165 [Ruminococcaceae bacterium]|nr:hypothetical protein [Oscillospiraceae bacterium]